MQELPDAVRTVMNNKTFLCEDSYHLLRNTRSPLWVTVRESQVLKLIGQGCTSLEIADKLNIVEATVKDHRKNLLLKFNVNNTVSLVKLAMQMGLIWVEDVP
jgi:DNA-binding NarL/FixJ family response regulator